MVVFSICLCGVNCQAGGTGCGKGLGQVCREFFQAVKCWNMYVNESMFSPGNTFKKVNANFASFLSLIVSHPIRCYEFCMW